ncbi:MAG: carbamoyltransferase [Chitinophagales bacterium]|nr:carbamoyltransferase [Chitinophagales bacterium]
MKILGISAYYHDAAVAIIKDGEIIYAAQEERFTRVKNDATFPTHAITDGLATHQLQLSDFDYIVFYEKPFLKLERIFNTYFRTAPYGIRSFISFMRTWVDEKLFIKQNIHSSLKKIDPSFDKRKTTLLFAPHHVSHAASAFYPSPFEEAAILTIDGVGEISTTSIFHGRGNQLTLRFEVEFPHSLGLLYSAITYFLGFKVNSDEYKVMGLASYGNKNSPQTQAFIQNIEENLITILDGTFMLNRSMFHYEAGLTMVKDSKWEQLFKIKKRNPSDELSQEHANLAYAFQKVLETVVLQLCKKAKELTGSDYLCLAGGVALNGVLNGIIADSGMFKDIFIQPAAGDAGGALGAALSVYHIHQKRERKITLPDNLKNSLLGTHASEMDCEKIAFLHNSFDTCTTTEELCEKTIDLICSGKVIGWYQGNMEFGPRALGNRSILADPRNPDMQLHLNLKIKNRESFRPFAPAVLEEDAAEYFEINGTSPYMLLVKQVRDKYLYPFPENYDDWSLKEKLYFTKSVFPAITHVDKTARIQTVNKATHPLFHQLLTTMKKKTGHGMLINTSFNTKDEPIVCNAEDAYQCFIKTNMDVLVLGNFILYKS